MRRRPSLTLPLLSFAAVCHGADFAADFNKTTNPGTMGWIYGLETSLGGTLSVYDTHLNDPSGYNYWYSNANHSGDLTPAVFLNQGTGTINGDGPGQAGLHPGPDGQFSVARYTVPTTATATILGQFYAGDSGSLNEYVQVNGVTQFVALPATGDQPFSFTYAAKANDRIDFIVGADAHGYSFDTTPLSATITQPTPEPPTLAALGLGLLALRRRRR